MAIIPSNLAVILGNRVRYLEKVLGVREVSGYLEKVLEVRGLRRNQAVIASNQAFIPGNLAVIPGNLLLFITTTHQHLYYYNTTSISTMQKCTRCKVIKDLIEYNCNKVGRPFKGSRLCLVSSRLCLQINTNRKIGALQTKSYKI